VSMAWLSRRFTTAVGIASAAAALSSCGPSRGTTRGSFWFDRVTFELPSGYAERLGGQITEEDKKTIKRVALYELRRAYSDYRIEFSESTDALYRVSVVDDAGRFGGAGQSIALGALGGRGFVSYAVLTGYAMRYAPPNANRATMIEGIGRGIGRAAAHEFAHQLVPRLNIHASRDPESYEYGSADRFAEYYGPIHWDVAKTALANALGPASPP
jgi:hypothetical protein